MLFDIGAEFVRCRPFTYYLRDVINTDYKIDMYVIFEVIGKHIYGWR